MAAAMAAAGKWRNSSNGNGIERNHKKMKESGGINQKKENKRNNGSEIIISWREMAKASASAKQRGENKWRGGK